MELASQTQTDFKLPLVSLAVVPTIQGYEDAGDSTVKARLRTSLHGNLVFYLSGNITGFAMACSNTFGLVTGAFLLGFGLSEIPKGIWLNSDWNTEQKVLSHKVAKMAVKLDDAHHDFSNAIVITQATSKQMSKRDSLRPYMNIIDKMLLQIVKSCKCIYMQLKEDPSFKPQGGTLGESGMDYDTDDKSMAALRRRLTKAREQYYRYRRYTLICLLFSICTYSLQVLNKLIFCSEYTKFVLEALELEDTIKDYERQFLWRCILWKQLEKSLAVILGCMSFAILLAEATIQEVLVQLAAFIPLIYMCICTYYSLFKMGMMMFYSLTPKTNKLSKLAYDMLDDCKICNMQHPFHTTFSTSLILVGKMGKINDAVPFFGKGFNKIYPLIMVIYTSLIASNIFNRVIKYCGNWKIFKFSDEAEDMDGFDLSGVIILRRECSLLQQGHKVGELVFPLARSFSVSTDVESTSKAMALDESATTNKVEEKNEGIQNDMSRKIGSK
ncbi:LMBR1 domain-containing protein 2 [Glycine max]|nr:LMBR1 domain-containing protein 2 [Glycine max]